jgi:hypothetical protein
VLVDSWLLPDDAADRRHQWHHPIAVPRKKSSAFCYYRTANVCIYAFILFYSVFSFFLGFPYCTGDRSETVARFLAPALILGSLYAFSFWRLLFHCQCLSYIFCVVERSIIYHTVRAIGTRSVDANSKCHGREDSVTTPHGSRFKIFVVWFSKLDSKC